MHKELAPYYSHTGRPSIDPVLMIRMLIVGYVLRILAELSDVGQRPVPVSPAGRRLMSGTKPMPMMHG